MYASVFSNYDYLFKAMPGLSLVHSDSFLNIRPMVFPLFLIDYNHIRLFVSSMTKSAANILRRILFAVRGSLLKCSVKYFPIWCFNLCVFPFI